MTTRHRTLSCSPCPVTSNDLMGVVACLFILLTACAAHADTNRPAPSTERTMQNTPLVVFDLETTGLNAANDRVIEIGLIRIEDRQVKARQSWLVNPGIPVPAGSQRIHGISSEMIAQSPRFAEIYPRFTNFVGNALLLSHNARFDRKFMVAEIQRCDLQAPDVCLFDTLRLFKRCFPKRRSYALSNLTADLCPSMAEASADSRTNTAPRERRFHSALWDAECTAALLVKAMETLDPALPRQDFEKLCGGRLPFPLTPPAPPRHHPRPPPDGTAPGPSVR